ncbi:LOW QUALITY PROTEIN: CD63 antigen [Anomalospiza imberbis]|uniref:LOW QUALITY PROTEIN: CD63 antigen n=1 Tax=Anomalospiza imberbis TaxID=187417 RepID=UPI00358E3D95
MAIEGGMKCVKFLVFFFNFIFWVCGVALIAIGIYALVALGRAPVAPVAASSWTPVGIVVLGVVIFFTSFFGCCGAWRESYCMVTTFAVLLSLIFLVEIAAAITGYVFKHKVHGLVEEGLWEAVRRYEKDPALSAALDAFQQEFSCCGVDNYTDWASVGPFGANDTVPRSCCRVATAACNVRPTPATVFAKGCLPSLEAWVKRNVVVLAAVALGIAFFEVLGVVFSCCLMRGIRSGYEVM